MLNRPINMVDAMRKYSIYKHSGVNHLYDKQPYSVHLFKVSDIANFFINEIPSKDRENVISAIWGHDLIEDCRVTYNDVKLNSNRQIADLIYAVTNEKGKTRKERANTKYYKGIRKIKYATFIKLCDRIANVEYAKSKQSKMFETYKNEHPEFVKSLKKSWWEKLWWKENDYKKIFDYLDKLIYESSSR